MPDSTNHRAAILDSIRRSLGTSEVPDAIAAEYAAIGRTYTRSSAMDHHAVLELFADRLGEYDAGVYRASTQSISSVIADILVARGKRGLAIPAGIPADWLPQDFAFDEATRFDAHQLDKTEGVMSGCTVAIAETGSIVLQNAAAQGRRILSLVPDYHLCVVFADQVVATVPEAFERLGATSTLPTTFISGPSATADIEMTRIKGVHGPRFLDVLIVEESAS
jgi:L-lactate dehydrogenase complex protein LldG